MAALYDRLTATAAWAAAWLFFLCGVVLCYEVTARYLFVAPTKWAEELARLFLVWGTFLAAAHLLRRRQHIRISIVTDRLPETPRRAAALVSLLAIAVLSAVCVWYGGEIAFDSFERGRTTGSLMNLPTVWTEASVPLGFALLGLQALIEAGRLLAGQPEPTGAGAHD